LKLLCKILKQDPASREGIIASVSALGILVNLLVASAKIILGLLTASMAILSEGINNATDAATAFLTLIGSKLSSMRPTKKHPFGFGRIEYLTGMIISVLIVLTGIELLKSSVEHIFHPVDPSISYLVLIIVAISAVIKFFLGQYTIVSGRKAESNALEAVGIECRNDSLVSLVTILSALVFLLFKLNVDAYASLFTSLIIIKAGGESLFSTLSDLLGRPGKKELADSLYKEIRACPVVLNAADMMLHNYGPDRYSGSVNLELDHSKTVEEVYAVIHALQLELMHKYHVTMVFGIYAVDKDQPDLREMRKIIADFVRSRDHVTSYHALYIDPADKKLYCDLVVDYDLKDWDGLRRDFLALMKEKYPSREPVLTIETEYV